jgi:hypothetical protein
MEGKEHRGYRARRLPRFASMSLLSAATHPRQLPQGPTQLKDVHQCASHIQPLGILRDAAIAHLGKSEDAFEHQERMLDTSADTGLVAIFAPLQPIDTLLVSVAPMGHVRGARCMPMNHIGLPLIGRVAPHPRLFAVQQRRLEPLKTVGRLSESARILQ